jgi:[ribosomal protein S5]-alanine N-acetyltransferase
MVINKETAVMFLPPVLVDSAVTTSDWRAGLPALQAAHVTLRELELADAETLCELLTTEEVSRFVSPPPTTVEGFERFIRWTHDERAAGRHVCFGIVPEGCTRAVGLIQVRQLSDRFEVAEWGFAIGSQFWGTGMFEQSARAVLAFTFEQIGVLRLEARACVPNGRGNGALRKLGAVCEATLSESFIKNGMRIDQYLWTIDVCRFTPAESSSVRT